VGVWSYDNGTYSVRGTLRVNHPILTFLLDRHHLFQTYFIGVVGALLGVILAFFLFLIISSEFWNNDPYHNSNYTGPDSTTYRMASYSRNKVDFSNVNARTIRLVSLTDIGLTSLPVEIASIDSLESLNLSQNWSLDLSASLAKLKNPSTIKILHLSGCELTSLPEELLRFVNLEKLYIGLNPGLNADETIQLLAGLPKLSVLWIEGNDWDRLPDSIGSLTSLTLLYANHNQFTDLPSALNEMNSLETLFLHGNPVAQNVDHFIDTSRVKVITRQ
jgi:Leucine-rich repeat (LRR) protein